MKKVLAGVGIIAAMLLSSCANEYDVIMVENQMNAEIEIAKAKSAATIAQSEAIALTVTGEMSDLERYFARMSIAGLAVTPSGIKSVTTGNDVLISLTQDGKTIVRDIVTGTVIYKGASVLGEMVKNAGGNTTIEVDGDGNTTSTSRQEVKMVNLGEGTQAFNSGSGGGSSDELLGTCDEKVQEYVSGMDLSKINLGGALREVAAETGCVIHFENEQVVVKETGTPVTALNSFYAGHKELGGAPEVVE